MNPIVIAAGSAFGAFALGLVVRAFIVNATEKDPLAQSKAGIPGQSIPAPSMLASGELYRLAEKKPHEHEWRAVTEFVKQCRDRNCGEVSFYGDVPEGMTDYVRLMTSRKAREDPRGEAAHYQEMDYRAWGPRCQSCGRQVVTESDGDGVMWDLAKNCPYCGRSQLCQES